MLISIATASGLLKMRPIDPRALDVANLMRSVSPQLIFSPLPNRQNICSF